MQKILTLFHHIHHENGQHKVHHCGGGHAEIDPELNYKIEHCGCGKHKIDKQEAVGHDFEMNKIKVRFTEQCSEGGWHIEGGEIV